jgi:hypothetical protein
LTARAQFYVKTQRTCKLHRDAQTHSDLAGLELTYNSAIHSSDSRELFLGEAQLTTPSANGASELGWRLDNHGSDR